VKLYTLDNGLRVITEDIPTFRSVSFGIWVKTGSRNETTRNNGISHFIEHMLFKGTARYSAKDIADIFDGIGGNINAFTAKEYTCYYAKVLDEHLSVAIDVLAEMFFHSEFNADEMNKEKNVILEEIAMYEDTPDDLVHDLVTEAAYGDHPLAYSILGSQERLQEMLPEHLRSYMHERYRTDNTVISVAGNIPANLLEMLNPCFGQFTAQGAKEELDSPPSFTGGYRFHKKKTEQNHICLSLQGIKLDDPNIYAMALLNNTIGGGMSSRLFQEIREERGLAYSIYSYHSAHIDSGLFTIYAGTAPGQTDEVLKVVEEVLRDIRDQGLTEEELAKGKEQLKGNLIMGLESTNSRMNRQGKNELLLAKHQSLDELIAKINQIQISDLETLIHHLFAKPMAISMVGDSDKSIIGVRRDLLVVSS
jgi:predicted Zn-dependent peptidase